MTNIKSTWAFQRAIDGVCTLPISPLKRGSKSDFSVFRNKIQFLSNKVCYRVSLCENCSGKVVEQSISYAVTEKYRTECVSFHLKYWLKLTYPVVASAVLFGAVHAVSVPESE